MSIVLVTGYAGEEHITSSQVASYNKATITPNSRVFTKGEQFDAVMEDSNTVRIHDGDMLFQGRHVCIPVGTYEDLTVASGTVGRYRKDLVVVEYNRDAVTGVESVELKVLQGELSTTEAGAVMPSYINEDIESSLKSQFPLWMIPLSGITVGTLVRQFAPMSPMSEMFNLIYPIGSIYMSVNSINPSRLFGGTWVEWGSGRVPVGVNASDSSFNTVEKTGGEKTHTLSAAEIPSHTHTYSKSNTSTGSTTLTVDQMPQHNHAVTDPTIAALLTINNGTGVSMTLEQPGSVVSTTGNKGGSQGHTHTISLSNANTGSVGSTSAHNVLQPYITCYMWKRTA